MAKIAFYSQHLAERGTGVAMFDYAVNARDILGHEVVVIHDRDNPATHPDMVRRFRDAMEVIPCADLAEADRIIPREGCDLMYTIKNGKRDGVVSQKVATMVHAVFAASTREVHGASYAFVSEWLADWCSGGRAGALCAPYREYR